MPWYNSDRLEPGKRGNLRRPVVVSSTGKREAFPQHNEPHNFTFMPRQAANRACIAEIPDSYLRGGASCRQTAWYGISRHAELHRLYDHRNVAVSGCKNDGNPMQRCLKLLSKSTPLNARYFMMTCSSNPASPPPIRGPIMGTIA